MDKKEEIKESVDKEQNAKDFMPKKEKPRLKMSRYTVMLVPDSTDDAKTYEITIDRIARYVVLALAVIVIIVSLIVSFAVKNYRLRNDSSLQAVIDNLMVEKQALEKQNEELTELVKLTDENVSSLKEKVSELELETAGLYIPNIMPYKGSALMISDVIIQNAISFSCLEGAAIITTANGVIESIDEDMYGYTLVIDHMNGYKTQYTIEEEPMGRVGDSVVRGEVITYVSEDDETFSYAVVLDGVNQDPKDFLEVK